MIYNKSLKLLLFTPIYLLLSVFLINYININNFDLLALLDHDEGFLIEQLLLKINYFNIDRIISRFNEYGVEFYYLSIFFDFILLFINLSKIDVYYIAILFHLIFSTASFFLIFKIFSLLNFNQYYYLFFSFVIIATPEIFYNSISLKPDLNSLLFFLTCSLYFFIKFLNKNKNKHLYFFLLSLSVSFTLKAWCVPFLILLFFIKTNHKKNIFNFKKNNKLFFLIFIILFVFLFNNYLLLLKKFILTDVDFLSIFDQVEFFLFKKIIDFYVNYFYLVFIFFNFIIFLILKTVYFSNLSLNIFKCLIFFFLAWFIIAYPFLSDFNIFFKSVIDSLIYTSLNSNLSDSKNYFVSNIISDFTNYKLNSSLLIILLLSPLMFLFKIRNNLIKNNIIIPLYLLSLISYFYINFFVKDYGNQFPAKYLYTFFILIYSLVVINFLSVISKKFNFFLIPIFLSSFINLVVNFNLYTNLNNFFDVRNDFQNILNSHSKIFNNHENLYVCDGVYPIKNKIDNFSIIRLSYDECRNDEILELLSPNDLFFISGNEYINKNMSEKLVKYYEDNHEFVSRYGKKKLFNFYFYKLSE